MNQPRKALTAFADAARSAPAVEGTTNVEFHAQLAEGEARAWSSLGDMRRATQLQEDAVRLTPEDARRWTALAELYEAQQRVQQAQAARDKADALRAPSPK
jgi:Flp pilus assembly protein TadD